jgi:CheY-like chemotaxis protein
MTSCSSLLTVINDILDLSKVEAGKMEIIRKPFGTRQLVDSIRDAFKDQAAKKGLELSMDVHPSVPEYVIGDTSRIRQILFNLVGNSMKFTPRGTIHVRMSGLSREDPRRVGVVFEVSDTGIGVSQEQMQDLFEPFTQVESDYSRSYQGTGLGLGIVKRLVLLMGGSLCMDSEPGRGTSTFFRLDFELPYPLYPEREAGVTTEAAAIEEGFEAQAPQESDVAASGEKSLSVLVAEDNRINRITATRFLAKLGHEAVCAESGEEALELLASRHFDCVLMDVQMPVMDGIEATSRIRAGEAPGVDPDLPVIAMTAHAMIGDREQIMKAGMDDYVAKPIEMDLLEAALARVAARRGRTGES